MVHLVCTELLKYSLIKWTHDEHDGPDQQRSYRFSNVGQSKTELNIY